MMKADVEAAAHALRKDFGDFSYASRLRIASVVLEAGLEDSEESNRINIRGNTMASAVCDALWGGEHAWESATDEEFKQLVTTARKRLSSRAK